MTVIQLIEILVRMPQEMKLWIGVDDNYYDGELKAVHRVTEGNQTVLKLYTADGEPIDMRGQEP
jgi:hypothetical protein